MYYNQNATNEYNNQKGKYQYFLLLVAGKFFAYVGIVIHLWIIVK